VKTIALERGLEELKQALEERGYHTVYADAMDAPVSVYIYQEQHTLDQESFHSSLNNSMYFYISLVGDNLHGSFADGCTGGRYPGQGSRRSQRGYRHSQYQKRNQQC
jgi:hypothetical protein